MCAIDTGGLIDDPRDAHFVFRRLKQGRYVLLARGDYGVARRRPRVFDVNNHDAGRGIVIGINVQSPTLTTRA